MRAPDQYVPGARTEILLNLVDFDWPAHLDHEERVDSQQTCRLSMAMSRLGVLAGPSSGMALAGPLPYLDAYPKYVGKGEFPQISNEDFLANSPEPE